MHYNLGMLEAEEHADQHKLADSISAEHRASPGQNGSSRVVWRISDVISQMAQATAPSE